MTPYDEDLIKSIIPRITGSLSLIGSLIIIYHIVRSKTENLSNPYHRLLACLSFYDMVSSIAAVWSSSALPKDYSDFPGAGGTWATCRIQGFLFQLGLACPYYFFCITCYFLCVITFGWTQNRFSKKLEPFLHLIGFLYPLGTASLGVALNMYNPMGTGCWISEYPKDCFKKNSHTPCIYGRQANSFRWLFSWFVSLFLIWVPINMFILYNSVKKQAARMRKYDSTGNMTETDLRRSSRKSKTDQRTHAVAQQSFSFFVAYLIVWIFPIINLLFRMYAKEGQEPPFWSMVLFHIFNPLQGFLNYLVYIRPIALKLKKKNPSLSFLRCVVHVTLFPGKPYKNQINNNSTRKAWYTSKLSWVKFFKIFRTDINVEESEGTDKESQENQKHDTIKTLGLNDGETIFNDDTFGSAPSIESSKCIGVENDNVGVSLLSDSEAEDRNECNDKKRSFKDGQQFLPSPENKQGNKNSSDKREVSVSSDLDKTISYEAVEEQSGCTKRRVSIGQLDFPGIHLFEDLDLPTVDIDEVILHAKNEANNGK